MQRLIAWALLFSFGVAIDSMAADWPTYLRDKTRVGVTDEKLNFPLSPAWSHHAAAPTKSAWEGPRESPIEGHVMKHRVRFDDANHVAVVDGRVYFGSSVDHHVYCVDAESGATIWTFCTDGPIRLAPTVANGKVYVGSDDGCVYCLNAADGKTAWQHRVGPKDERILARGEMISRWPVRTGVIVDDGMAYFGAGIFPHENVYMCAADAETGALIWKNDHISQQDAGRNDLSPQGYLLANDDLLFVPSGRSMPAAFNRKTGEFVFKKSFSWRSSGGGVVGGSKAMLADGQLFSSGAHHFIALNEKTGDAGFAFIAGQQMTFRGDKAYIATGKNVIAVDRDAHAKASVKRQELYVKRRSYRSDRKKLAEVDAEMERLATVGILWSRPFDGEGSLILTGDHLVAGGENVVVAFDIASGAPVWKEEVQGEVRGLAAAGGGLYVSTNEGKIYAFLDAGKAPKGGDVAKYPETLDRSPFEEDELTSVYQNAAKEILAESNADKGFCLILGSEQGRLAYELATRTDLKIYGIEPDAEKAAQSRDALMKAGLYGHRVVIAHGQPAETPFSNYFANLVVSDSMLLDGKLPATAIELGRYVKPCGGVACFGAPQGSTLAKSLDPDALKTDLAGAYLRDDAAIELRGSWVVLNRGKLADVGEWSHQYGGVGNTSFSEDYRLSGSLGVLWYGDPGPQEMVNRHEAAAAPLSVNGRFFTQGVDSVRAYDAYNGQFLWEHENPGAIRTGVFNNYETSNLSASDDALFVCVKDKCTMLDAATGEVRHEFTALQSDDDLPRNWGYVANHDGVLFGTSTIHRDLARTLRRRGRTIDSETDAIFAHDINTHDRLWVYRGKNIMHVTITIGDGKVFFVESSITQDQRDALLNQDKSELKNLTGEARRKKEEELKKLDVRMAVALNAKTGEELWRKSIDVTNCSGVSAGGGNLAMMYRDDHLLICGANANGHYWRQFLAGEFKTRRLVVLEANSGQKLWSRDADYMNRPAIVNDMVLAEPWAFELHTGEERKRPHPLTNADSKWQFSRPGHHCGIVTATPYMMFFRSGFIGYYDLYSDSGTRHFAGQRLGCWVNALPSNGLVVIPEASAGCVCLFSITSTVVLEPRQERSAAWGIYSAAGPQSPVKQIAVNLGAPGDRRDGVGKLWLSHPRPSTRGRMEFVFDFNAKLADGGEYYSLNHESEKVKDAVTPWVYTSGARGLTRCELPLRGKDDSPAVYNVKLHFAELNDKADEGTFDVKIQGDIVAENVNIAEQAGGVNRALVLEREGIKVQQNLVVELIPHDGHLPSLAGVEAEIEP